jgi:hypothetical protein
VCEKLAGERKAVDTKMEEVMGQSWSIKTEKDKMIVLLGGKGAGKKWKEINDIVKEFLVKVDERCREVDDVGLLRGGLYKDNWSEEVMTVAEERLWEALEWWKGRNENVKER